VETWSLLGIRSCHLQIDSLIHSFLFTSFFFLSFALAKISKSILLNKSSECGQPYLIPRKLFQLFHMQHNVDYRFVLYMTLMYDLSSPSFFRNFIMKVCWILSNAFFCIYWDDDVINVSDPIYVLYDVQPPLYPCNETNLTMKYDLLKFLIEFSLQEFCRGFLRLCTSGYWSIVLILAVSLSSLSIRVTQAA
jgi:hypothetical protein